MEEDYEIELIDEEFWTKVDMAYDDYVSEQLLSE